MHYLPDRSVGDQQPEPRRLRIVGIVCDACGREETEPNTRLEGWHRADDGSRILCHGCAALVVTDNAVLFWLPCGHLEPGDAVLHDGRVCATCDALEA